MTDFDRANPTDNLSPSDGTIGIADLKPTAFTEIKGVATTISELPLTASMARNVTQSSQEAEDFVRIWTAVYESVVHETRNHAVAVETADQSWEQFRDSTELVVSGG